MYANRRSQRSLGSHLSSPFKEFLCAPHAEALSLLGAYSPCAPPLQKSQSLSWSGLATTGQSFQQFQIQILSGSFLDDVGKRVLQVYYNTGGGGSGVLSSSVPEIFSLGRFWFHLTVSVVSTSQVIFLHHWCSWLLHLSTATPTLCSKKFWFGLQCWQLLCLESLGNLLLGALWAGRLLSPLVFSPLSHLHALTHTLTDSPLDVWVDYSVVRLQDGSRSGSKWMEFPSTLKPSWVLISLVLN